MPYIKILRPTNLWIIALTQGILFWWIIRPGIEAVDPSAEKPLIALALVMLITTVLTGAGYVINDLYDYHADLLNKPGKVFIRKHITEKSGWIYYFFLIGLGLLLSMLLAYLMDQPILILFYCSFTLLLYLYSKKLKHSILAGNIIIALFTALVPGALWFIFFEDIRILENYYPKQSMLTELLLFFYILFAFQVNFTREMVKDVEDIAGDKSVNSQTMATALGKGKARSFIMFNTVVLLIITLLYIGVAATRTSSHWIIILSGLGISGYMVKILLDLSRQIEEIIWPHVSTHLKILMVAGLAFLILSAETLIH